MAPDEENPRGINAQRVLSNETSFTLEKLIRAAYDPHLVAFETLIPALLKAYNESANQEQKKKLEEPISALRTWDYAFQVQSIPTTLAIYWGQELRQMALARGANISGLLGLIQFMAEGMTPKERLDAMEKVVDELTRDYGNWRVAWGEVNRYQRLTGEINETYDDSKPSLPVAFASSFWGSLASFGSKKFPGTKKMYGYGGNSFVAAVEFGPRVRAKSILAGGNNSDPRSPYFINQADLYSKGEFKDVLFYKEDVMKSAVRQYQPGK
jgi:acyl-homoserine lactone acylase PvdQ